MLVNLLPKKGARMTDCPKMTSSVLLECFALMYADLLYLVFKSSLPVAERLRALFLNHSIISPLCLVWVRAPLWPRETSQVLLAGVPGVFSWGPPVLAHLLIGPSHMS